MRNALRLTLETGVRTGVQVLPFTGPGEEMLWTGPAEDDTPTQLATFEFFGDDGHCWDRVVLEGAAWRELDSSGSLIQVRDDVRSGASLVDALAAQINEVENHYRCDCGSEWIDTWSCAVDDECPGCTADCSPHTSNWVKELVPRASAGSDAELYVLAEPGRSGQHPTEPPAAVETSEAEAA